MQGHYFVLSHAKYRIYLFSLKVDLAYGRWRGIWHKSTELMLATKKKKVENALRSVAPHYHSRCQTDMYDMCDSTTAQHVNSVSCKADYFGHKLYVDQNGKLEIYGFVHVAAIDGHSCYNKVIYAEFYRLFSLLHLSCLFVLLFWWNISMIFYNSILCDNKVLKLHSLGKNYFLNREINPESLSF